MPSGAKTALDTVKDYITDARTLLQDTISPNRYDDPSLITCLNVTLLETRRVRPDLFVFKYCGDVPQFSANDSTLVYIEKPFRLGVLYGMVAHALSRDQEDIQDARASEFMNNFDSILLGVRKAPLIKGQQ